MRIIAGAGPRRKKKDRRVIKRAPVSRFCRFAIVNRETATPSGDCVGAARRGFDFKPSAQGFSLQTESIHCTVSDT